MFSRRLRSSLVLVFSALAAGAASGQEPVSCCDAEVSVGFSERVIRGGFLFDGIAGAGELCTADEGEIVSSAPAGTQRTMDVYMNLVSNLERGNVQGWSFGVELTGVARILHFSARGTASDFEENGGYRDPDNAFYKTQIIDPSKNSGRRGLVSAVAQTTGSWPPMRLPPVGTESLLVATFSPDAPQGEEDQVASLRFRGGLVGAGQPVALVVTVDGESASVCNFDLARVRLVFRQGGAALFRRGDANGDREVDIADPIWILNGLFLGGPVPPCADAADANDDGVEDVSDAIHLIDFIFLGTRGPPPAPGPEACGPDPTEDAIGCTLTGPACP